MCVYVYIYIWWQQNLLTTAGFDECMLHGADQAMMVFVVDAVGFFEIRWCLSITEAGFADLLLPGRISACSLIVQCYLHGYRGHTWS